MTLRVSDSDAAKLAYASDKGKVWLVLRPPAGAKQTRPSAVTLNALPGRRHADREGRSMTTAPIRTLVAVDASINPDTVESILDDPGIEIVGVIQGTADGLNRDGLAADVLLVACEGHSQESLDFIKAAIDDRPDRPVVVVYSGQRNGFVREFFERGRTTSSCWTTQPSPGRTRSSPCRRRLLAGVPAPTWRRRARSARSSRYWGPRGELARR